MKLSPGWLTAVFVLTACAAPAATPEPAPPTATHLHPATSTPAPTQQLRATPTVTAQSITVSASAAPPPAPTIEVPCATGAPWYGTQAGVTLYFCVDPRPPALGQPAAFEVVLFDATGQPIADVEVRLTLVGGMAGMLGEHDEDFSVTLARGEPGRYSLAATVGPPDLILTGVIIQVQRAQSPVAFEIPASQLAPANP